MGLQSSLQEYRAVSGSIAGDMVGKSATWVWACLLKTTLCILRLKKAFTVSLLEPAAPTKAFWSIEGFQIDVDRGI